MSGKYKVDRSSPDTPEKWDRRSAHKTLKSALIDIGRSARRDAASPTHPDLLRFFEPKYYSYRVTVGGFVVFNVSGKDACNINGSEDPRA